MISKPIPYGHQYITDEDVDAVVAALKSDYMTQDRVSASLRNSLPSTWDANMLAW